MRRREFIAIAGATAAWPLTVRAQQSERMRRIGVLMNTSAEDPSGQAASAAFAQGLQKLGWEVGNNIRLDYRWGAGDHRSLSQIRGGIGRVGAGCDLGNGQLDRRLFAAGEPHHTHRVRYDDRPGWRRFGCQSGTPRRQCYWL